MARKLDHDKASKKGKAAKTNKAKRGKDADGERGMGDNSRLNSDAAQSLYTDFRTLKLEQQEANGEFNSDLKQLYEKAGGDLGLARQIISDEFNERFRQEKRAAKRAEMDTHERQRADALRKALGPLKDSPLGEAAIKAQAKASAAAADTEAAA